VAACREIYAMIFVRWAFHELEGGAWGWLLGSKDRIE
jgi:hypothetical protein